MKKFLSFADVKAVRVPVDPKEMTALAQAMKEFVAAARRHERVAIESAKKVRVR